jgi:hypothetical protein
VNVLSGANLVTTIPNAQGRQMRGNAYQLNIGRLEELSASVEYTGDSNCSSSP